MTPFDRALDLTLRHEGGFVNHHADRGGATNHGITQGVYNAWRLTHGQMERGVAELSPVEIQSIYLDNYWKPARCDLLPEKLDLIHFDAAVNHGVNRAVKMLQTILRVKPVSGFFGTITEAAVEKRLEEFGEEYLSAQYLSERLEFYSRIVANNPSQQVFYSGWLNRIASLKKEVA